MVQLDDVAGPRTTTVLGTNIYETRAGRELTTPRPDARGRGGKVDSDAAGLGTPPDDLPPGYERNNMHGNFDIVLDLFSRILQLCTAPDAPLTCGSFFVFFCS